MEDAGRDDWKYIGYMEQHIALVHAQTGVRSVITLMHPGGGSAYAYSYKPQKIVESLAGGEKPAVLLIGHYHKLSVNSIRNVWTLQTGTSQDQTSFMRLKAIDAHVGGLMVKLTQDPKTGAISRCRVDLLQYFNRGYTSGRWSHSESVAKAPRAY